LVIEDSIFDSNSNYQGGALSVECNKDCKLTIKNSSFINNTANLKGGAIYITPNINYTFDQLDFQIIVPYMMMILVHIYKEWSQHKFYMN